MFAPCLFSLPHQLTEEFPGKIVFVRSSKQMLITEVHFKVTSLLTKKKKKVNSNRLQSVSPLPLSPWTTR